MKEINTHSFDGLDKKETGYTFLCTTDMSRKLDDLFGFDYVGKFASKYAPKIENGTLDVSDIDEPEIFMHIQDILAVSQAPVKGIKSEVVIPVSREVDKNYRSALTFLIGSEESMKVAEYFYELATKVGFFFALPFDEVCASINPYNVIRSGCPDLETALEEGYIRKGIVTHWNDKGIPVVELTTKFCPLEKRPLDKRLYTL